MIASLVLRLPTTANEIIGLIMYAKLTNFAMASFSSSSLSFTSERDVNVNAGGPIGINIIENQRIGSPESQVVLLAIAYMTGMDILY
jgi:hypothetical protein